MYGDVHSLAYVCGLLNFQKYIKVFKSPLWTPFSPICPFKIFGELLILPDWFCWFRSLWLNNYQRLFLKKTKQNKTKQTKQGSCSHFTSGFLPVCCGTVYQIICICLFVFNISVILLGTIRVYKLTYCKNYSLFWPVSQFIKCPVTFVFFSHMIYRKRNQVPFTYISQHLAISLGCRN